MTTKLGGAKQPFRPGAPTAVSAPRAPTPAAGAAPVAAGAAPVAAGAAPVAAKAGAAPVLAGAVPAAGAAAAGAAAAAAPAAPQKKESLKIQGDTQKMLAKVPLPALEDALAMIAGARTMTYTGGKVERGARLAARLENQSEAFRAAGLQVPLPGGSEVRGGMGAPGRPYDLGITKKLYSRYLPNVETARAALQSIRSKLGEFKNMIRRVL